uniref:PX domain-containing protein n=1 Tax=Romanomermis culicivorax TaxID=13658 RepID=A0A915KNJ8_ROMCU
MIKMEPFFHQFKHCLNVNHVMPFLSVEHPVTYTSWELGRYTTYDVCIDCTEDSCPLFVLPRSSVARRYSQFRWLKKRLSQACP